MKLPKLEKALVLQYVVYSCMWFITYAVSTSLMEGVYEPRTNWFKNVLYVGCAIFTYLFSQRWFPTASKKKPR